MIKKNNKLFLTLGILVAAFAIIAGTGFLDKNYEGIFISKEVSADKQASNTALRKSGLIVKSTVEKAESLSRKVFKLPEKTPGTGNIHVVRAGESLNDISLAYKTTAAEIKWLNGLKDEGITPGQNLKIPKGSYKDLKSMLNDLVIDSKTLSIKIDKTDRVLGIFSQDRFIKSYHIDIGEGGLGDKQIKGDKKTPEGDFYITEKETMASPDYYLGSRWLRLSYPNKEDAARGFKNSIISRQDRDNIINAINNKATPLQDTPLGGAIGIHGGTKQSFGKDWTWGCMGLKDSDVEDFYDFVGVGTQVSIEL